MAKKKHKKEEEKKKFEYSNEVIGIILILASIIGIGAYGPAGNFIRAFSIFLVGNIYIFLLAGVLVLGGYLIIKRKMPDFFNLRWIGLYTIITSFLVLLHTRYITLNAQEGTKILTETFDNLLKVFSETNSGGVIETISHSISNSGGGMIGALFTWAFYSLFKDGTKIVVITLIVIGAILLLNTSIIDLIKKIKMPKIKKRERIEKDKKEDEIDKRIILASSKDIDRVSEKELNNEPDIPIKTIETSNVDGSDDKEDKPIINPNYKLPPLTLLKLSKGNNDKENVEAVKQNINTLEKVLADFEIPGKIKECHIGPSVTQYEMELQAGTKVNKLLSIQKEIALNLAAKDVRIQAPIPGKSTIGIELPNKVNSAVSFREVLSKIPAPDAKSILAVGLGKDIMGTVKWAEINTTPHLLIAGATGSGKSVCINCIIASILMRARPDEVKLVMVDPKKVELSLYNKIERHYLAKLPDSEEAIITDTRKVVRTLNSLCIEMDLRYDLLKKAQVRNIKEYNPKFISRRLNPENGHRYLPYIVVVVDEFADLIMTAGKEVEHPIARIAQLARAVGIHLIIATQRPSVNIITGTIKANFPARIAFRVTSKIDSRTILDTGGADQLIGRGDLLLSSGSEIVRLQCALIDTEEIEQVAEFIGSQRGYPDCFLLPEYIDEESEPSKEFDPKQKDEYFEEAAKLVVNSQHGSTSLLQRKLQLGYNRAGRIIDQLEAAGVVGPVEGSKAREVLIKTEAELMEHLRNMNY